MSFKQHMRDYQDVRTLYHVDQLHAWKHGNYFPPVMVEVSPTHLCNQKCRYCYSDTGGTPGDKLADETLVDTFRQIAAAGVKSVLVQGTGEPLMHKGLSAAVAVGAELGLAVGLTTNGVLLDAKLQQRLLTHLHYVRFSVIDNNPARYAYLHGCSERQWHALMDNIRHAAALRASAGLPLALWGTVYLYQDNFDDTEAIVRTCKDAGLDYIVVQEATYTELSPAGKEQYASASISDERIQDMKRRVMALSDDDFLVRVRFPINDGSYMVGMNRSCWCDSYCQGIKFYSLISSDGEVYPCWRFWGNKAFSYGNIRRDSLDAILRGPKRKEVEQHLFATPPTGDECEVCNITKLNEILYKTAHPTSRWREFLI